MNWQDCWIGLDQNGPTIKVKGHCAGRRRVHGREALARVHEPRRRNRHCHGHRRILAAQATMISAFTGTQIRAAEQPLLDTGEGAVLMQRAAYGLANAVVRELRSEGRRLYGSSVTVLAGKGNNGGDGLFAAAMLARRGMRTTAVLTAGSAHPDALAAFRAAGGRVHVLDRDNAEELAVLVAGDDAVIDAILGTGARGGLARFGRRIDCRLEELRPSLVVACDIPSGVDADTGEVHWPVLAARFTVAFGGIKAGLMADPGEGCAGRVILVPIGIEEHLPAPALRRFSAPDLAAVLPEPGRRAQKYTRGVLGIVAGSERYTGAAALCVEAASAAGAGMVRYLGPGSRGAAGPGTNPRSHLGAGRAGPGPGVAARSWPGRGRTTPASPRRTGRGSRRRPARRRRCRSPGTPAGTLPAELDPDPARRGASGSSRPWRSARHAGRRRIADRALRPACGRGTQVPSSCSKVPQRWLPRLPGRSSASRMDARGCQRQAAGTSLAGSSARWLRAYAESGLDDDGPFAALGIAPDERWAAVAAVGASIHGMAGSAASAGGPLTASDIARAVPGIVPLSRGTSPPDDPGCSVNVA